MNNFFPNTQPLGNPQQVRADFFYRRCIELIFIGYERLTPHVLHNEEEPAVTGELVGAINEAMQQQDAPDWVDGFAVKDNPPANTANLRGKNRPQLDIEIEYTGRPRYQFSIEAKWVGSSKKSLGARKGYLGEEGIGCFLSQRYPASNGRAGMLAYIHSDDATHWSGKIRKMLHRKRNELFLKEDETQWAQEPVNGHIHVYVSIHACPGPLRITHVLLEFPEA